MPDRSDPTDLPVERVRAWLVGQGIGVTSPLSAELITGGRSNLTYRLTDGAGQRLVLRRPPLSGVVASAHDVRREGRIMAALADTPVPVPPMLASTTGDDVLDAPFIVMGYVDGIVLRDQPTAEASLAIEARAQVSRGLIDSLVQLHSVDVSAVGLADLGKGVDYVSRQLTRWAGQLDRLGVAASPQMHVVLARLQADVPAQTETTIVHGDFRPGNVIVGDDGSVRAVVDWELATLGDPRADMGWLLAYWGDVDAAHPLPMSVPTMADGFGPASALTARYVERGGRSVDEIDYFIAFALWRLAAILAGVQARARQGAYGSGGKAIVTASGDERIERLVAAAAAAADRAGR